MPTGGGRGRDNVLEKPPGYIDGLDLKLARVEAGLSIREVAAKYPASGMLIYQVEERRWVSPERAQRFYEAIEECLRERGEYFTAIRKARAL